MRNIRVSVGAILAVISLASCATPAANDPVSVSEQTQGEFKNAYPCLPVEKLAGDLKIAETIDPFGAVTFAAMPDREPEQDLVHPDFFAAILGEVVATEYVVMRTTEGVDDTFVADFAKTVATVRVELAHGDLMPGDCVTVVLDGGYIPVDSGAENARYAEYLRPTGKAPYSVGDQFYVVLKKADGAKAALGEFAPLGTPTSKYDLDPKSGRFVPTDPSGSNVTPLTAEEVAAVLG